MGGITAEERERLDRLDALGLLQKVPALELAVAPDVATGLAMDGDSVHDLCEALAVRCSRSSRLDFVQPTSSYDGRLREAGRVLEWVKTRCRGVKEVAIGAGLSYRRGQIEPRDLISYMVSQVKTDPPVSRSIKALARMLDEFAAGADDAPVLLVVSDWTYSTRFVLAHVCGIQEVMDPIDEEPIDLGGRGERVRLRFDRASREKWLRHDANAGDGVWFDPREWVFAEHSGRDIEGSRCRLRVERADRIAKRAPFVNRWDYEERLRFIELSHDQEVLNPVITNGDCGYGVTHIGLSDLKVQALRLCRHIEWDSSSWYAEKLSFLMRPGDMALHHCFTTRQTLASYLCNNPGMEDLLRGYLGR